MLDILPVLLWIIAAVIAVNICSICSIRGGFFSHKERPVYPVRWSIIGLHFASLVLGALPYPLYSVFKDRETEIEKRPVMPGEAQKGRADITGRRYVRADGNYFLT